jgi:MotA/TolQ/ExbB proton channel family
MLERLLVFRLFILNVCGIPLVFFAWSAGLIDKVVLSDTTYISHGIVVLFAIGLVSLFSRAFKISKILDAIKKGEAPHLSDDKIRAKAEHIDDISAYLVRLGLIGTVVGFGMALDLKDIGSLTTAAGAMNTITTLLGGMKVAINTTITGAILSLWLDMNARFLKTATECALFDARIASTKWEIAKIKNSVRGSERAPA